MTRITTGLRLRTAGILFALAIGVPATALAADAKRLAKFDVGYSKCEALYPQMQGHRDDAYLNLWRIKSDDKARSRLAATRKGSVYKTERQRAQTALDKDKSPDLEQRLKQECQATWAIAQREPKARP